MKADGSVSGLPRLPEPGDITPRALSRGHAAKLNRHCLGVYSALSACTGLTDEAR
jgi:hypothetical protein